MSGKARSTIGSVLTIAGSILTAVPGFQAAGAVLIVAGGALSYDGAKRQQKEAERRARAAGRSEAIRGNVRSTHAHHLLLFGKTRVGGIVLDQGTSAGAEWLNQNHHLRVAHSLCHAGGSAGIGDFWIDDTRVPFSAISGDPYTGMRDVNLTTYGLGIINLHHWKGAATQGNDADFPGGGGAATAYCRGMASTHFKLIRPDDDEKLRNVYKYGSPTLSVEDLGILCYDPRLDSTMGGSGAHRTNDETTWTSSDQNPALWTVTYLLMKQSDGGLGQYSVLGNDAEFLASVAAAANRCDELMSTPSGNKTVFSGGGIALSTADDGYVNLQKLLDCMGPLARLVPVDGGVSYRLYASGYRTPTFTIDQTWLAGGYSMSTRGRAEPLYNAVRVNYDDAALDYKTIEAPPYTSSTYEAEDGEERRWHDLTLPGVTDGHRAQYIAQIFHKKSRYQATLEVTLNLKAMDLELYENGAIVLPGLEAAADKVWKLAYLKDRGNVYDAVFEEDHSSIYTVETFLTPVTPGGTTVGFQTPGVPGSPTAAAVENGTRLAWTNPRFTYEVIEIHRSDTSGGVFTKIAEVPVGVAEYTDRLETGAAKYYKLRARSRLYVFSAFTAELNPTTTPAAPTSPVAESYPAGIHLTWTKPASDLAYEVTEIHRATSSGGTFNKVAEAPTGADSYIDRRVDGLTYYYKLRVRNRLGIVSAFTSEVSAAAGTLDVLADGAVYGRTKLTALTAGEVDLSKAGVIGRTLGNIADDATYGRTKLTALTSGEVDLSKAGVLNRSADHITESGSRKWAAESGADVTAGKSIDVLDDVKTTAQFFTYARVIDTPGSGTVTIPTGARILIARAWGPGGGGGRGSLEGSNIGGGGGGAAAKKTVRIRDSDWGQTISYNVGTGGLGRTGGGGNGLAGDATTVTASGLSFALGLSAGSGQGGTTAAGGAGGTAAGGDTNTSGFGGIFSASSEGGDSATLDGVFGEGGFEDASGSVGDQPQLPTDPGGGGAGNGAGDGQNGENGMVSFTWSGG